MNPDGKISSGQYPRPSFCILFRETGCSTVYNPAWRMRMKGNSLLRSKSGWHSKLKNLGGLVFRHFDSSQVVWFWKWLWATRPISTRLYQIFRRPKYKRYGVIWASSLNLGDDIQTLAALELLAKNGIKREDAILIDRERLSLYKGPPVKVIMNGWYTHTLDLFLPPKSILPLFISFHATSRDLVDRHKHYFRQYAPIGCRDATTKGYFDELGIEAYVSGCFTLCFETFLNRSQEGKIYRVNLPLKGGSAAPKVDFSLWPDSISSTHFVEEDMVFDIKRRLDLAQKVLDKYRQAKLVITTRLHVALPCRAFGTPVLFFHNNYHADPRFQGLREYLRGMDHWSPDNLPEAHIDPAIIEEHKKRIDEKIAGFVSSS